MQDDLKKTVAQVLLVLRSEAQSSLLPNGPSCLKEEMVAIFMYEAKHSNSFVLTENTSCSLPLPALDGVADPDSAENQGFLSKIT